MSEFSKATAEIQGIASSERYALVEGINKKINRNNTNSQLYLNVICSDDERIVTG